MLSGIVFDVQRLCVHDGPGIRTTIFLKGCSLQCFWCHNPESIKSNKQIMFFNKKCIDCGRCVEICRQKAHSIENNTHIFDRRLCNECGECAQNCAAKALVMSGITMTVEQVMEEILKDISFFRTSNGGVTFSGGEPLLQIDFLEALLIACKEHDIHTAIETAGNVSWKSFERIAPYTDLFLYDLKLMDSKKHKLVTGVDNQRCLSNLERLMEQGNKLKVRVPIIPQVNDSQEAAEEIAAFVFARNNTIEIEPLLFHKMGQSKYDSLDLAYKANELEVPDQEMKQKFIHIFSANLQ